MRNPALPHPAWAIGVVFAAALLQAGCSSEPTATSDFPALNTGIELTAATVEPHLGGPDSIYVSGSYVYSADYLAPYAYTAWAVRSCPTLTVASCSTTWFTIGAQKIDDWHWKYTTYIPFDCSNNKKNSFQVRVEFHAFGHAPPPLYKVTKKCGTPPILK